MKPSNQDIELHLQKKKFEQEVTTRTQVAAILNSDNPDDLAEKIDEIMKNISDTSKNDLIHYVSMRKCVLDIFSTSLELDEEGKYKSEGEVHDVIMRRRNDSDDLAYDRSCLRIWDERLKYRYY